MEVESKKHYLQQMWQIVGLRKNVSGGSVTEKGASLFIHQIVLRKLQTQQMHFA
ncbi:MAG: hypothetical protein WA087_00160 [Candidatus Saccharimonadales bacterium]